MRGKKKITEKVPLREYHSDEEGRGIKRIERGDCRPRPGSEPQVQAEKGPLAVPRVSGLRSPGTTVP